ncbi:heat stress transcription factor A-2c-like [Henckelia pumila]|uniref:heat stress transcription factor A-2c-like n=1 Tax=Henckelia pumila TaxID=405737 RepID=UPI003C6E2E1F
MNYRSIDFVKGEFVGSGSLQCWDNDELIPQPFGALLDTGPPAFLSKTYDFVEDPSTNEIVSWSLGNNSFIVWDPQTFATNLLPNYFKHNNFSSFVRQLNTYGFKKVNPDRWEFANEGFLRGQRHLLKSILRRKTQCLSSQTSNRSLHSCVGDGSFGLDEEIDCLSRNKQVLEMELVKLRQQQRTTLSYLQTMEQRLKRAEMEQKHTISLFAKALQNPMLLQRLMLSKSQNKDVEEVISNKRRRTTLNHVSKNDVGDEELVFHERENTIDVCFPELGQESEENADKNDADVDFYVKLDPRVCCEIPRFGDLELEKLALSMQKPQVIMEEKLYSEKGDCKPNDEGLWEELIYEMIDDIWTPGVEEGMHDLVGSSLKYKAVNEEFCEKN